MINWFNLVNLFSNIFVMNVNHLLYGDKNTFYLVCYIQSNGELILNNSSTLSTIFHYFSLIYHNILKNKFYNIFNVIKL